MDTKALRGDMRVRLMGALLTAVSLTGCTLNEQKAPDLTGPSGWSTSIAVTAAPDHLVQDGASQTVVTATVRNATGAPVAGLGINWTVEASNGTQVSPSTPFSVTNADGKATTIVTAPAAPATVPASPVKLTISAQAQGTDATTVADGFEKFKMSVEVELVPPAGTLAPNRLPVAAFTISPPVANINETVTFDASSTTDEGAICDTRCTYLWSFGPNLTTISGKVATRAFAVPGSVTVTLYVTDERGGTSSTSRSFTVTGPVAPNANFSVLPASPTAGVSAVLNGSLSTVGAGATITQYDWDFGDGTASSGASAAVNHTWATAGSYAVILTVTDSLGRTDNQLLVVTVQ
jgi:PKD domain-containing protein/Big-like domain-containing protein